MDYNAFDIVTVPFPFTDSLKAKKRPAVILSNHEAFNEPIGHSVLAMITSSKNNPWPLDVIIKNMQSTGLSSSSVIRMKLFTLDNRMILQRIGHLSEPDKKKLQSNLQKLLSDVS